MSKINKDTNVFDYRIRKYLSDLMDRVLVIRDRKRLVLKVDDVPN
ncbi:Hypothetical protein BHO_0006101 (plasmid) [Borrelia hermsii YBT]|nr:Hypothetical protein BHO_0006101 [Borrelia hermsii YBT]